MFKTKSIDKIITIEIIFSIFSLGFIFLFRDMFGLELKYFVAFLLFFNILLSLVFTFKNKIRFILIYFFYISLFYSIFLFIFRPVRDIFPTSGIKGSEIIGFYNYFKYPIFFDYLFFILIIFVPVVIYFLLKIKTNEK